MWKVWIVSLLMCPYDTPSDCWWHEMRIQLPPSISSEAQCEESYRREMAGRQYRSYEIVDVRCRLRVP